MSTAPSTEIAFLSLNDAKVWLDSTGDTDNDGMISDLVNAVSARFEAETGRNLKSRSYTEIRDGNGKNWMYTYNYPFASTAITITIDEARAFTSTADQVTSTNIHLTTQSGKIWFDNDIFDAGERNVQIEYTAGYTTSAEYNLVQAAKEYLSLLWARRSARIPTGVVTEGFEGGSRTYEDNLPWSVRQILQLYKDPRVV